MNVTPGELSWIYRIDQSLREGASFLVIGPKPVQPFESLRATLWERYWEHPLLRDYAFTESTWIGEPPDAAMGRTLRQDGPVGQSDHLREGLRHKPIYCLLRATEGQSGQKLADWVQGWTQYLRQFHSSAHPNSRLRLVLVPDWPGAALQMERTMPDIGELTLCEWPAAYEDELATLARQLVEVNPVFQSLSPEEQTYLWLRCLDLAGGSRPDLEQSVRLAEENCRSGAGRGWLEELMWRPDDPWVLSTQTAWQPLTDNQWKKALLSLVDRGGMIIGVTSSTLEPLVRNLWEAGLWVNGRGLQRIGWLTPAAIAGLKTIHQEGASDLVSQFRYLSPAVDRIATDLLNRCLIHERLLKQRFLEYVESRRLGDSLRVVLTATDRHGNSLWDQIVRRIGGVTPPTPIDMIWELSLGQFLTLRQQMTGLSHAAYADLLEARNDLAHGRPATWRMFQAIVALETEQPRAV